MLMWWAINDKEVCLTCLGTIWTSACCSTREDMLLFDYKYTGGYDIDDVDPECMEEGYGTVRDEYGSSRNGEYGIVEPSSPPSSRRNRSSRKSQIKSSRKTSSRISKKKRPGSKSAVEMAAIDFTADLPLMCPTCGGTSFTPAAIGKGGQQGLACVQCSKVVTLVDNPVMKQCDSDTGRVIQCDSGVTQIQAVIEAELDASASSSRSSKVYYYTTAEKAGTGSKAKRKSHGPVSANQMKKLWRKSKIGAATLVWRQGIDDWKRIDALPDLNRLLDPEWDSDDDEEI